MLPDIVRLTKKTDAGKSAMGGREVPKAVNSGHCEQSEAISCIRH
jgi:hypothetical protein